MGEVVMKTIFSEYACRTISRGVPHAGDVAEPTSLRCGRRARKAVPFASGVLRPSLSAQQGAAGGPHSAPGPPQHMACCCHSLGCTAAPRQARQAGATASGALGKPLGPAPCPSN